MITTLPPTDVPVVLGFLTWVAVGAWTWRWGWRIQGRHLAAAGQVPVPRTALTWWVLLLGAAVLVAAHARPGLPGVVTVAMVGLPSALVDARTHRLPDAYTAVMAGGVALGALVSLATSGRGVGETLRDLALGVAVWTLPLVLGHLARAGVGLGDVKLAPVLGALTGLVSWEVAVAGLVLAFLGAGLNALTLLLTRTGTLRSRIPMGPWLLGGAVLAHAVWGVLPGWV